MAVIGGHALEDRIYARLASIAPGLVFHAIAPDNQAGEFIVFQRQSTQFEPLLNGYSQLIKAQVQVDCFSSDEIKVADLAYKVKKTLGGYREGSGEEVISACWPVSEFTSWDPDERGHRRTIIFQVMMRETTQEPDGGPLP